MGAVLEVGHGDGGADVLVAAEVADVLDLQGFEGGAVGVGQSGQGRDRGR
ncbi:hypothetical protein [Kitasatospora albolonga]